MQIELEFIIKVDGTPNTFGYKIEDAAFDKDMLYIVNEAMSRMCNKATVFLNSIVEE